MCRCSRSTRPSKQTNSSYEQRYVSKLEPAEKRGSNQRWFKFHTTGLTLASPSSKSKSSWLGGRTSVLVTAFHPFGNQAAATDTHRARPLALRPGLATGLPFRGCEAARLQSNAFRKESLRSERDNSKLLCLHLETYVTIPVSQIVNFRKSARIFSRRRAAVPQPRRMDFQSVQSRGKACKDGLDVHPTQFYNPVLVTTDCAITDVDGRLVRPMFQTVSWSDEASNLQNGVTTEQTEAPITSLGRKIWAVSSGDKVCPRSIV